MMSFSTLHIATALLALYPTVLAQPFIVNHGQAVAVTRLDPIVNPGTVGTHTHIIVGGSAFSSVYDGPTYVNAKCTTGNVEKDKSNYWTPVLYWKANDGTYSIVKHGGANTYYNNRFSDKDTDSNQVFAFPPGFMMLGGNPKLRAPGPDINDQAHSYACLDGDGGPETLNFPNLAGKKCGQWRAQINMPNCWDGKRATSADNSHYSYPIGSKEGGVCPAGFKRIPAIFYEFFYDVKGYDTSAGKFVLSNGDETGYSFHGDFVNGWDQNLIEQAVSQCYGKANDGKECHVIHDIQHYDGSKCTNQGQMADEPVGDTTKLTALPGLDGAVPAIKNVLTGATVQAGAAPAPAPAPVAAPAVVSSAAAPAGSSMAASANVGGGSGAVVASSKAASSAAAATSDPAKVASAPATAPSSAAPVPQAGNAAAKPVTPSSTAGCKKRRSSSLKRRMH